MRRNDPDRKLNREIEQAWYRLANGVQVNVLDIPKIFRDIKTELSTGATLEAATVKVRDFYRVKVQ